MSRLLIIEDQENVRRMLAMHFEGEGFDVSTAADGDEGVRQFLALRPDAIICDVRMPKRDGYDVLYTVREEDSQVPFLMVTAHGDVAGAVRAMREGASDYTLKPFNIDELTFTLNRLLHLSQVEAENLRLKEELKRETGHALVGQSTALKQAYSMVEKVAPTPSTVLLVGETGVGKELFARAVHDKSPRARGPFVAVNCGAIPETLFESELFGHRKGSFTDADRDRKGRFEEADRGTLFLDEIGELPLSLQPKLLRVLEAGEIQKIGENQPRRVDVRLVAATNRNLKQMVSQGGFREDLFFRLNVFPVTLPPLRDRQEDIPLLAHYFLERYSREFRRPCPPLDEKTMAALCAHPWPGNVRELSNTMERLALLYDGSPVENLVPKATATSLETLNIPTPVVISPDTYKETLHRAQELVERTLIQRALDQSGQSKIKAAKLLGIGERTLFYKLKELGLGHE